MIKYGYVLSIMRLRQFSTLKKIPILNMERLSDGYLQMSNNNLTGRIAAFIDKNLASSYDQPTGGIGFFECINDKASAIFYSIQQGSG